MENQISEKESLELIGKMINSARNNLQKGTGNIFLLWGYLTALISLVNLLFLILLPPEIDYYSYYCWFAMSVGGVIHIFMIRKIQEQGTVRTYIDQILSYVWIAFSISVFALIVSMLLASIPGFRVSGGEFDFLNWIHWGFLIPFMLILYGFALFVTGKSYRFRPLVIGAIPCWAMAILIFLLISNDHAMEIQFVGLIISVIAGYIIPGHLLNKKENSHV
jgi:hypothetical protein